MAETAVLPARARRKDSELLKAWLSAARRFSGQARHVHGMEHSMAVRTDGVRRRRHWAGSGMVSATSPVRAWRVVQGERDGKAVQHGRSHSARSSGR
jgi:hypothetical protein